MANKSHVIGHNVTGGMTKVSIDAIEGKTRKQFSDRYKKLLAQPGIVYDELKALKPAEIEVEKEPKKSEEKKA